MTKNVPLATDVRTFRDALRWFVPLWESERPSFMRLHLHSVEPDSRLGSPKIAPEFIRYLTRSANEKRIVPDTARCPDPSYVCALCGGDGWYETTREVYRYPMAAAMNEMRKHPDPWPRHTVGPVELVLALASSGYNIPATAARLGLFEDQVHDWFIVAVRKLVRNWREEPAVRISWTDKSEAQRTAEEVA